MKTIPLSLITSEVKRLCIEANYDIRKEVREKFSEALEKEESPRGKDILQMMLENAEYAAEERIPYCQDTGVVVVFVELGEEVCFDAPGFMDAINDGVRQGYTEGLLRKSMVKDPLNRENTGDNTPAVVHVEIVRGDGLTLKVAAKGSGSENMSRVKMLTPAEGIGGVKDFVVETVSRAGPNACPPGVVGVGIGGDLEKCAILAKKALYRGVGTKNLDPFYSSLEEELLDEINGLGIGPQSIGGTVTVLEVHIEVCPCHIGSLPVAVNLDCHAHRYKEALL